MNGIREIYDTYMYFAVSMHPETKRIIVLMLRSVTEYVARDVETERRRDELISL